MGLTMPLIIDELGFVPLSQTGAELLFELISQRYERSATIITSTLPFTEWAATTCWALILTLIYLRNFLLRSPPGRFFLPIL